jgi:hypothetical protein
VTANLLLFVATLFVLPARAATDADCFSRKDTAIEQSLLETSEAIAAHLDPFAGRPSLLHKEDFVISKRDAFGPSGEKARFSVRSGIEERALAISEGRLREHLPGTAIRLPEGSYTMAVLKDGTVVTGRVLDNFEIGVKHVNLAHGREVMGAGELKIHADGSYEYNTTSGHFSRVLVESKLVTNEELAKGLGEVLHLRIGRAGAFRNMQPLLPETTPAAEKLRGFCSDEKFAALGKNSQSCCLTVSLRCAL